MLSTLMSEPDIWCPLSDSAHFPKFVINRGPLVHEFRKAEGTSNFLILVPLSI
jgi:hypothetical protein